MELNGPFSGHLTFWRPTGIERWMWVLRQACFPLLLLAGLWFTHGILRSTRRDGPFTTANERRLWWLAAVAAIAGTATHLIDQAVENWLIQRSAAADLVPVSFQLKVTPLFLGGLIAVLASIWNVGIALRDDADATI